MINNILHNALIAITNNTDDKFDWYTPLTFTAQEPNSTINLTQTGSFSKPLLEKLQYKTNNDEEWSTYNIDTTITLTNINDYVQFQNTEKRLAGGSSYVQFVMTGKIAASGNIQSMLNYETSCAESCYRTMFKDCTSLTTAPTLPAKTLADYCYAYMFEGCTNLTKAPELPATTLTTECYRNMFSGCKSLTTAPTLPATELANYCYLFMFSGCSSLTEAPELPATNLAHSCYKCMFQDCASLSYVKVGFTKWDSINYSTDNWLKDVSPTGTFVCPEELDKTQRGENYIPEGWTVEKY